MSNSSRAPSATTLAASERLILTVVRAARAARAPTPELREAVREYVHELKTWGYPPERVLVAVKTLVAEGGIRRTAWADRDEAAVHPENEIIDQVVTWCIEEYFPAALDGR